MMRSCLVLQSSRPLVTGTEFSKCSLAGVELYNYKIIFSSSILHPVDRPLTDVTIMFKYCFLHCCTAVVNTRKSLALPQVRLDAAFSSGMMPVCIENASQATNVAYQRAATSTIEELAVKVMQPENEAGGITCT